MTLDEYYAELQLYSGDPETFAIVVSLSQLEERAGDIEEVNPCYSHHLKLSAMREAINELMRVPLNHPHKDKLTASIYETITKELKDLVNYRKTGEWPVIRGKELTIEDD